jgi:hypothetical protein
MGGLPDESAAVRRRSVAAAAAAASIPAKPIPRRGRVGGIPVPRPRCTSPDKAVLPPGDMRPLGVVAFPAVPAREEEEIPDAAAAARQALDGVPHDYTDSNCTPALAAKILEPNGLYRLP